LKKNLSQ